MAYYQSECSTDLPGLYSELHKLVEAGHSEVKVSVGDGIELFTLVDDGRPPNFTGWKVGFSTMRLEDLCGFVRREAAAHLEAAGGRYARNMRIIRTPAEFKVYV
ncbi:hypothetical protein HYY74_05470 [Candidatus Woesearchaeota archaeon]|nr:hypothetical protein [Candidatus Woesearchaeota archaeon]